MKIPTSKSKSKGQSISKILKEKLSKGDGKKEIDLLSIAKKVAERQASKDEE